MSLDPPASTPAPSSGTAPILSLSQDRQLYTALLNAFPKSADLERLAWFGLGMNLQQIVAIGPGAEMTFHLMRWAESHGRLADLWIAAGELNPSNLMLREVLTQLSSNLLPPSDSAIPAEPLHSAALVAFRVPFLANPLFVGRATDLDHLHTRLATGTPVAVTGVGGVGKTQLAVEYAYRYRFSYPGGIFWLNMTDPAGVAGEVAACAGPDGLRVPGWDPHNFDTNLAQVRAAWQEPVIRLLIFDNLEDPALLATWRPKGGGCRVLITSRRMTWAATTGVQLLPLVTLQRDSSIDLLLAPRAREQGTTVSDFLNNPNSELRAEADAICATLGDLPLALALAGAYLGAAPQITLNTYQKLLGARLLDPALDLPLEEGLPTEHNPSLAATFALSYDQLDPHNPADTLARTLLHHAAVCAPAPIPPRLLLRAAKLDLDGVETEAQAARALARLAALGLLEILPDRMLRLHPLLSVYLRSRDAALATSVANLQYALIQDFESFERAGNLRAGIAYLEHLRLMTAAAEQPGDQQFAQLLKYLGDMLNHQGDYAAAHPLYRRALEIYEHSSTPNPVYTAASLDSLANLLYAQGDYTAARPLYERALSIREQILGPTHPDTATSLNNLGSLLFAQGDYTTARRNLERALHISEQSSGPNHPDTATSLNNLAYVLQAQGDYSRARPLYERALGIREQILGASHPDTASSLDNLGGLLQDQDNYDTAAAYFARALAIREQSLGSNHPDTARSLDSLAYIHQVQNNYSAAIPLLERTLAIREQVLGPNHPDTANSLNNLGSLLRSRGDYTAARPLLDRALAIREQVLGPNHPDTASSLNNLGRLLQDQGDYRNARPLVERAFLIGMQMLGENHPNTQTARRNLETIDTLIRVHDAEAHG